MYPVLKLNTMSKKNRKSIVQSNTKLNPVASGREKKSLKGITITEYMIRIPQRTSQ